MPTTEMVAMVAVVAALALGFVHIVRLIATSIKYRTLRRLVEVDPGSASTLLNQDSQPETRSTGDERLAVILIAIAIAMIGGALIAVDDKGMIRAAIAAALFPLLVGAALGTRAYFAERRRRATGE